METGGKSFRVRPGAAIGEIDSGVEYVVGDLDDIERGEVAGYNGMRRGRQQLLMPRISREDYEALMVSRLPEVDGYLEGVLNGMAFMTPAAKAEILQARKAVRQDMPDGTSRVILVDRLPDAMDEIELAARDCGYPEAGLLNHEELSGRRKTKKYSLTQVFNDVSVMEKYDIGLRQYETAKRLSASNAKAAASLLQDAMNSCQSDVNVKVTAGIYTKDKAQAKRTLGLVCYNYKPTSAAVLSDMIGEALFLYGPAGADDWHVSGPIKHASEVAYLYWMVAVEGTVNPNILLSLEMSLLGLSIFDGVSCAAPDLQYHAGYEGAPLPPVGFAERTAALLTSANRQALESYSDRLLPVLGSDGIQMATAVRVTGLHVLVNSHVFEADPLCTIAGRAVEASSQLSRDLWSAKCEGESGAWSLREPVVGESVAVCYVSGGRVSCSSPLQITAIDGACIVTTMGDDVVARMSGGALVGLSDLALLGVHSASTWTNLLSYKFGPKQFSSLLEAESESCFSREGDVDSFARRMSEHFKKRGLGSVFSAAIKSLSPVYVGPEHVGMAVNCGKYTYTACDADFPLRFGEQRAAYVMETADVNGLFRTVTGGGGSVPVFRRNAVNFEKAFVVGYDTDAYMSSETSVLHVGPNGRSFIIGALPGVDKPVTGGLVMGFDGAVLGVCGPVSATTAVGLGYVCWPLPAEETVAVLDARVVLSTRFPFLNIPAWPESQIERVFTHSSVGKYNSGEPFNAGNKPLANIGDNAAKAELYNSLMEAAVPHSTWSVRMQSLQSNSNFAKVAWKFGFAECLLLGHGAVFSRESKAYADLTEALLGAAYLIERRDVFVKLCQVMGILYMPEIDPAVATLRSFDTDRTLRDEDYTRFNEPRRVETVVLPPVSVEDAFVTETHGTERIEGFDATIVAAPMD